MSPQNTCQNIGGLSTQDDPCRLNIGGRDPCSVDAYAVEHVCRRVKHSVVRGGGGRLQTRLLQRDLVHTHHLDPHCVRYDPALRTGQVPYWSIEHLLK